MRKKDWEVFNIAGLSLVEWLREQPTPSFVIQEAVAEAMESEQLPATPVEDQKFGVRLSPEARSWLRAQMEEHDTVEAEAEAVRACLAQVVVEELLALIEHYKSGENTAGSVEEALWTALGYTPATNDVPADSAGTASSQTDKGDP
jgi:hypothetical protein